MPRFRTTVAALATAVVLGSCATNPVTGERELALISESQEIQMGQQAAQQVAQSIGLVQDEALQRYVSNIGLELARDSERPDLPWSFAVVEDPSPNAFALPGGFIFVTRGLLTLMNNEAELATVLGHEIGHVTARHSVQQMSRSQLAQIGIIAGSILSPQVAQLSGLASQGLQLLFLRYGREDEFEADDLGFRYALQHGYDVRQMASTFASLARASQLAGSSPLPTWLSSHPYPEDRIARNQQRVEALDRSLENTTVDRSEFLQRIDGLVYGQNPRLGFFDGNVFLHPELRFRMAFPQGWTGQNMSTAVVAVSPQQDAAIQLTLAGNMSPSSALQQFLSQQGIAPGQAQTQTLHGNPAAVGTFQAQQQDGSTIQGIVAMVQYGGNTYQLLGYAPAQRYGAYDAAFQQSIGTFQAETRPQVTSVRPNRVDIVQLDRAMTLVEFQQRYPSEIPIEELALINQVEGPNTRIPAGASLKRVVEQ